MTRILSRALPAVALLAFAAPAFAQNTVNLQINANVVPSCRVQTAAPSITINYNGFDDATASGFGTIAVRCTRNLGILVAADGGQNGGAGGLQRSVAAGADEIGYRLSLTAVGPELALNTATSTGTTSLGRGIDNGINLHATLDTGAGGAAGMPAGAYSDTVLVTFTVQ